MMTDFLDEGEDEGEGEGEAPARASARSNSGRPIPPIARPPSLRNERRDTPSQYRCPEPSNVSMARLSLARSPGNRPPQNGSAILQQENNRSSRPRRWFNTLPQGMANSPA